nr:1,4-dihydroxy-2-naphthoyl-CoA thioesterase 1-like [Coffea arabica]
MVLPKPLPPPPPPSSASEASENEDSSGPLGVFGFQDEHVSPEKVSGWFQVTPKCCQPFMVLHGGVSALIAEDLGSRGAYLASGRRRAAGIQLSISRLKNAQVGGIGLAEATRLAEPTPVNAGKTTVQVWKVQFWKIDSSNSQNRSPIASSRVTLPCSMS